MDRPNCCRSWRTRSRVERRLGESGCGGSDAEPSGVEGGQRDGHALARVAHPPAGVTSAPSKMTCADRVAVQAHLALGGAERRCPSVSAGTTKQDSPRLGSSAGAHERGVEVGVARVRDPRLGALEPVREPVRLGGGPGGDRGDVRAGLGLRQAVGAELVATEHARQQGRLLLVGAELRHGVAGERVHRDADRDAHPGRRDLLHDLQVDLVGLAAAAELLGVGQRQQPGLAQQGEGVAGELRGGLGGGRPWGPAARSRSRGSGR